MTARTMIPKATADALFAAPDTTIDGWTSIDTGHLVLSDSAGDTWVINYGPGLVETQDEALPWHNKPAWYRVPLRRLPNAYARI